MTYKKKSLEFHKRQQGKIQITSKVPVQTKEDLDVVYTPGVAEPCKKIVQDKEAIYQYTSKGNSVAIITDGSAVLGLGNIGPIAALPVMEGKAVLFKEFANVNAYPICLDTQDVNEIVQTIIQISPAFGGINLEDISAPRCFEIEEKLKNKLNIPVFHDDQHGTAIVVLAALINSLKLTQKKIKECRVVINGSGAAGIAIGKLLHSYGFEHIILCDSKGIITKENANNFAKKEIAQFSNRENRIGTLKDALIGADIFIGVSVPNCVTKEMIQSMNSDSIIFAMANPIPEIMPEEAQKGGARIIGTGRSDFPNQINNVLAFPGIFRGALSARALQITEEMKISAAEAIAGMVKLTELNEDYIIPDALNKSVADVVAKAVIEKVPKKESKK